MITHPDDAVSVVTATELTPARLIGFDQATATVDIDGKVAEVPAGDVLCAQCGNWESVLTCTHKLRSRFNHATIANA